jgi:hypothetical protein
VCDMCALFGRVARCVGDAWCINVKMHWLRASSRKRDELSLDQNTDYMHIIERSALKHVT